MWRKTIFLRISAACLWSGGVFDKKEKGQVMVPAEKEYGKDKESLRISGRAMSINHGDRDFGGLLFNLQKGGGWVLYRMIRKGDMADIRWHRLAENLSHGYNTTIKYPGKGDEKYGI